VKLSPSLRIVNYSANKRQNAVTLDLSLYSVIITGFGIHVNEHDATRAGKGDTKERYRNNAGID